jgi:hypothetical protein
MGVHVRPWIYPRSVLITISGMPKFWPIALLSVLNSKYKIRVQMEIERDRVRSRLTLVESNVTDEARDNRPSTSVSHPSQTIRRVSWMYHSSSRCVNALTGTGGSSSCRASVQNQRSHILNHRYHPFYTSPLTRCRPAPEVATVTQRTKGRCPVSYMSYSISKTKLAR